MADKKERLAKIIECVSVQKYASIPELADMFGVSEMTIRRDLGLLESSGALKVIRGVAITNTELDTDVISLPGYELVFQVGVKTIEKNRIGKLAASLISSGDSIILDTGTTTEQIAKNIPFDIPLKVMCNNLNNLLQLKNRNNIELMVAGGLYKPNTQLFTSDNGVSYIKEFRFNKAFISAAGIDQKYGITCMEQYEVTMKKAMIESSIEHILVLDNSKFGKIENAYFADFDSIDLVITDSDITDDWKEFFDKKGIKLYFA